MASSPVVVDDSDTSKIVYSMNWFTAGAPGEFNVTTHATRTNGANATLVFNGECPTFLSPLFLTPSPLAGTRVSVYGTIPGIPGPLDPTPAVSSYTVDGGSPSLFIAQATNETQYQKMYYQSPRLSPGTHTLVVTSQKELAYLWLDFFAYDLDDSSSPPVATSTARTTTTAPTSTGGGSTVHTGAKSAGLPTGAVAGIVVSGIAILAGLVLLCFLFYRRKKQVSHTDLETTDIEPSSGSSLR